MPSDEILPPFEGEIEFLFKDDDIAIVNKVPFFLSVPGRHPGNYDSVQSRIQKDYPESMCAHRLDLDTSGIMIVALHKDALRVLHRQFQERKTYKEYVAEVYGLVSEDRGSIDLPLIADWPNRPRQKVCYEDGKNALTHWSVTSRNHDLKTTRLLLNPITGRSHQLRLHMKEFKHPILGCDLYAHDAALAMSPRLLLHASKLSFTHPTTGEKMTIESAPEF